jgi:hypothetical protein
MNAALVAEINDGFHIHSADPPVAEVRVVVALTDEPLDRKVYQQSIVLGT